MKLRFTRWIDAARSSYVTQLTPVAQTIARNLLGMELSLSYRSGWGRDRSFDAALKESWTTNY